MTGQDKALPENTKKNGETKKRGPNNLEKEFGGYSDCLASFLLFIVCLELFHFYFMSSDARTYLIVEIDHAFGQFVPLRRPAPP